MIDGDSTAPQWIIHTAPLGYEEGVVAMQRAASAIRSDGAPEQVWLLEHPPLYTAGTSAKPADLVAPGRFATFAAGRGGQWTYHGPGQVVAYLMLDLTRPHGRVPARDTHAFVTGLEDWLINTLSGFGVAGERRRGRVGIWVVDAHTGAENKIASIGVRITRWISWHGIALNVCPELDHFSGIIPCGIREHGVTSLRALGSSVTVQDVKSELRRQWRSVF